MHSTNNKKKSGPPVVLKIVYLLLTFIGAVVLLAVGACFVLLKGPSPKAKELFTLSCNETSAMKWLPGMFLPHEEVEAIINPNGSTENSRTSAEDGMYHITIVGNSMDISFVSSEEAALLPKALVDSFGNPATGGAISFSEDFSDADNGSGISGGFAEADASLPTYELIDISRGTFKGKMLLVHDPSKVTIASIPVFGGAGWTLSQFIEEYNALACLNAGGFEDEDGKGKGGIPDGIVIRDGSIVYGSAGTGYRDVVGFDANNRLHVGNMTGSQALSEGIINGMSFSLGPVLIKDGERQSGFNSGVNPRSAIGQTADGTIILIAIEGRMIDSLGATFENLTDIMEEYGAINAANLDGGSSSGMYYEGERITRSCSVIGDRPLPTAIIVNR